LTFWDSSALVPLLVTEPATAPLKLLAKQDAERSVWWATEAECTSAIARRIRDRTLDSEGAAIAFGRLRLLATVWHEIEPKTALRENAIRILRVHFLRAADALQLAAAFVAADGRPSSLELVTLDDRLAEAARKEGFILIDVHAN
jgi:predicted nucleic acid-binding protein